MVYASSDQPGINTANQSYDNKLVRISNTVKADSSQNNQFLKSASLCQFHKKMFILTSKDMIN